MIPNPNYDDGVNGDTGEISNCVTNWISNTGLKISDFCCSCDVCQSAGKLNQKIYLAPLYPIPVLSEPFERLIIDYKTGHHCILTVMQRLFRCAQLKCL